MQPHDSEETINHERSTTSKWPLIAGLVIGLAGIGYGISGTNRAEKLTQAQVAANSTMSEMQKQMQSLNDRINAQDAKERESAVALASAQQEAAAQREAVAQRATKPEPAAEPASRPVRRIVAKRTPPPPPEDPRIVELQKKFSEHDEKLADTQRLVESTRSDFDNKLNAKSDELSGSIARTSDEVAALRKRGERDYFEFDMVKSKQLQRVGPVSLALRKADTKHKRYNINMVVDDNQLEKKNVNLLEPVYFTMADLPHPVEMVVNRVDKDRVAGYISVPKYKRSELNATEATRSSLTLQPNGTSAR